MRLLVLLYCLLLLNLVFLVIPYDLPARDWWPFFDGYMLTPQWYVMNVQNHLTFIILSFALAYEARAFRREIAIFAWIQVIDFVDYLLTNNSPWLHIGIIPVSWNTISILWFGLIVWKHGNGQQL